MKLFIIYGYPHMKMKTVHLLWLPAPSYSERKHVINSLLEFTVY